MTLPANVLVARCVDVPKQPPDTFVVTCADCGEKCWRHQGADNSIRKAGYGPVYYCGYCAPSAVVAMGAIVAAALGDQRPKDKDTILNPEIM